MAKAKPLPPKKELSDLLQYDANTGVFIWRRSYGTKKKGQIAGQIRQTGYIEIGIKGKRLRAHRIAWLLTTGKDPFDLCIDHINGNKSDNRFSNLRLATSRENSRNMKKSLANKSGFKGVCFDKRSGKWKANIRSKLKQIFLGYFPTPELAHMAYCKAAAELHGEFARGA